MRQIADNQCCLHPQCTVDALLAWYQAPHRGEKEKLKIGVGKKKATPFFAFFPHFVAWSKANALSASSYVQWNYLARFSRNQAWKLSFVLRQCEENFCVYEKFKVTRQRHATIKRNTWLIRLIKDKTHIKATIVKDLFRVTNSLYLSPSWSHYKIMTLEPRYPLWWKRPQRRRCTYSRFCLTTKSN